MTRDLLLSDINRIAVLRAGGLGDLILALPAIDALAAAYPGAEITLCGSGVAAQLLGDRPGVPHRVLTLPRIEGVGAPAPGPSDTQAVHAFVSARQHEHFDLAVQLHGGGKYSNPLVLAFDAVTTIGMRTPDAVALDRTVDYVYLQHDVMRWLEVVGLVGATPSMIDPIVEPTDVELRAGSRWVDASRPTVAIHPGATDLRRRWPATYFADVIAALAGDGVRCVIVGDATEVELCREITDRARALVDAHERASIVNAATSLSFAQLIGVLALADVFLGSDSGPRHLAQALGTATVGIYLIGNLLNAGPLWRDRHRVHVAWTTECPRCHIDATEVGWNAQRCEHDDSFVEQVRASYVLADVRQLLARY